MVCDQVWLSGGLVTRKKLHLSLEDIVIKTGQDIGYKSGNWIDAKKYQVTSTLCVQVGDPRPWSGKVNDQCISIGYAGYDKKTHFLPPEHFLGHIFRLSVTDSYQSGLLKGQGPDGKLMVRLREEPDGWILEHILITLQQQEKTEFLDFCGKVEHTLKDAYHVLKVSDQRWLKNWEDVEVQINPNGPLLNGGSDGDNGQTGRKLVMDYYGPRIPIGGGALSGKDPTHIDRAAAYCAREAAVRAVQSGARACLVRLAYAPNCPEPIDIDYTMEGRGIRQAQDFFLHENICERYRKVKIDDDNSRGGHFFELKYPWNGLAEAK